MKRSILTGCAIVILAAACALTQSRGGGSSDDRSAGGGGAGSASIASRGAAPSTPVPTTTSRDYSSTAPVQIHSNSSMSRDISSMSGGGSTASVIHTPDLSRTSFVTPNLYFRSQEYFWYLYQSYGISPLYFRRFYRNSEPLLTPQIAKLTLRQPLELSTRMLAAADELEELLRAREAGQKVNPDEITARTDEIRSLARKIRQNQSVEFFDQRKDKDVLKGINLNSAEAVSQLRELITSLNTQLKGLYEEPKPFAVSVGSLTQPSFQSLSKGIEKLSKSIESSARKI